MLARRARSPSRDRSRRHLWGVRSFRGPGLELASVSTPPNPLTTARTAATARQEATASAGRPPRGPRAGRPSRPRTLPPARVRARSLRSTRRRTPTCSEHDRPDEDRRDGRVAERSIRFYRRTHTASNVDLADNSGVATGSRLFDRRRLADRRPHGIGGRFDDRDAPGSVVVDLEFALAVPAVRLGSPESRPVASGTVDRLRSGNRRGDGRVTLRADDTSV